MNEQLLDKLDELFKTLNDCEEIKEMRRLKEKIYQDEYLKKMLDEYRKLGSFNDNKKKELKKTIIEHPFISSYRNLENELYFAILEANQKLGKLTNKKRCQSESN